MPERHPAAASLEFCKLAPLQGVDEEEEENFIRKCRKERMIKEKKREREDGYD